MLYPNINPIAFQIGPLAIRWYGIMYIFGFAAAWALAIYKAKQLQKLPSVPSGTFVPSTATISDLIFYCALGVIIGGRLGYVLFYNFSGFIANPISALQIWHGGMSFHGGLIGVVIALWLFARKFNSTLLAVGDFMAILVPIGLLLGRIGNFINAELPGRITTLPWGIIYPNAGPLPRHPSQFYEGLTEGVLLFIILWFYSKKPKPKGAVTGMFLLCYGIFRFSCEFFREPDNFLGFIAFDWLTMGQLLSLPMIIIGAWLLIYSLTRK